MEMTESKRDKSASVTESERRFDYGNLEPAVATFLRGQAERVRRYIGKSLVQIGKDLIESKRYLAHGEFVRWVESEVGIPARTAQGYMRIAQWAEGRGAKITNLPASVLYVLAAKTTPATVIETVLHAVNRGEAISISFVREKLRAVNSRPQSEAHHSMPTNVGEACGDNRNGDRLLEVANILARRLPIAERALIYNIMTDPSLIQDADLRQRFMRAFQRALADQEDLGAGLRKRSLG
jgi:hypothetical protein